MQKKMYKANNNKDIQVKEKKRTKVQTMHIPQLVTIYAQNDRPSAAFNCHVGTKTKMWEGNLSNCIHVHKP